MPVCSEVHSLNLSHLTESDESFGCHFLDASCLLSDGWEWIMGWVLVLWMIKMCLPLLASLGCALKQWVADMLSCVQVTVVPSPPSSAHLWRPSFEHPSSNQTPLICYCLCPPLVTLSPSFWILWLISSIFWKLLFDAIETSRMLLLNQGIHISSYMLQDESTP